ncbi:hypothetical protein CERSUDRAFT_77357 [Gelatoporia subvermispora B]|uniref:Uncharacterized protein n=1 Tax=Ceriporiopsis subvermispora (strain B) TaxID=914234 RepID=M2R0E2_CERS8|nr:hypothetical protein CERSUDRAFT_77357 [Gelatoporia subvermispora B]
MVGRRWTTAQELAFLKEHESAFIDFDSSEDAEDFWEPLFHKWFRLWPEIDRVFPGQDLEETQLDDAQRAKLKEAIDTRQSQLKSWYSNNTKAKLRRSTFKVPPTPAVKVSTKKSRSLHESEMFSSMFYKAAVKDTVSKTLTPIEKKNIKNIRRITKDIFESQSDDVKEEVRSAVHEQREALKKLKEIRATGQRVPPMARQKQEALRTAAREIDAFFRDLAFRTDWTFTCLAGGPVPTGPEQNSLRCYSYHIGHDTSGNIFEKVYPKYAEHISGPFGYFVKGVYGRRRNVDQSNMGSVEDMNSPLPELADSDLDIDFLDHDEVLVLDTPDSPATSVSGTSITHLGPSHTPAISSTPSTTPSPHTPSSASDYDTSAPPPAAPVTSSVPFTDPSVPPVSATPVILIAPPNLPSLSTPPNPMTAGATAQVHSGNSGSGNDNSVNGGLHPSYGHRPGLLDFTITQTPAPCSTAPAHMSFPAPSETNVHNTLQFHAPHQQYSTSSQANQFSSVSSSVPGIVRGAGEMGMDVEDPLLALASRHPSLNEFLGPELDPAYPDFQVNTYPFQFESGSLLDELAFATSVPNSNLVPAQTLPAPATLPPALSFVPTVAPNAPTPADPQPSCTLPYQVNTSAMRSTCRVDTTPQMESHGNMPSAVFQPPQPQALSVTPLPKSGSSASGVLGLHSAKPLAVTSPRTEASSSPTSPPQHSHDDTSATSTLSSTSIPTSSGGAEDVCGMPVQQGEPGARPPTQLLDGAAQISAQGALTIGDLTQQGSSSGGSLSVQTGTPNCSSGACSGQTPPSLLSSRFSDSSSSRPQTPAREDSPHATTPPTTPRSSSSCSTTTASSSMQGMSSATHASPNLQPFSERPRRERRAPKPADYFYAEPSRQRADQPHVSIALPERVPMKWLEEAKEFLYTANLGPSWPECIQLWLQMESECGLGSMGRLGAVEHRPAEFSKWFTSGRNYKKVPAVQDTKAYGTSWLAWWRALQPHWRISSTAPSSSSLPPAVYEDPSNDWKSLKKSGPTGFVTVLVGLAFWAQASPRASHEWKRALNDVHQCLRRLVSSPSKRAAPDVSESNLKPVVTADVYILSHEGLTVSEYLK